MAASAMAEAKLAAGFSSRVAAQRKSLEVAESGFDAPAIMMASSVKMSWALV